MLRKKEMVIVRKWPIPGTTLTRFFGVFPKNVFSGDTEPNGINYLRRRFLNVMVAAATWLIRPLALATLFLQCAQDL